jgi:rare lipoprotein A
MKPRPLPLPLPLILLASSAYLGVMLTGCTSTPTSSPSSPTSKTTHSTQSKPKTSVTPPFTGGGYYRDDGPGLNTPDNLDQVPDAVPRHEPLHRFANNTYKVLGKTYKPLTSNIGYRKDGEASWYGRKFHGKPTSSGEPYDMYAMTAAHPTLPIPSYARVTNPESGKKVIVRINDRGPFHDNRLIDLSYTAAYKLGVLRGVTPVTVEAVLPDIAPDSFAAQASETSTEPAVQPVTIAATAAPEAQLPTSAAQTMQVSTMASSAPSPEYAYYLQLGAFSTQIRADDLLQQVTARLSRSMPGVMRMSLDGLYKVHAGPFNNEADADAAALQLRNGLGLKSFKLISKASTLSPAGTGLAANASAASVTQENTSASSAKDAVYLQVAAVSSATAAEALGARIKARYGAELPGIKQVQSGVLYKVQLGPFASPEAASQLSLAYQQDFGTTPYRVLASAAP